MSTIEQTAQAFVNGKSARCHNAHTDGQRYTLHRTVIVYRNEQGQLVTDWGGFYTRTTASHMNAVLKAFGSARRVSYAKARDSNEGKVTHLSVA
jgi:hypothetical protein